MCFDPATGAMSYLREHLEDATDTFAAVHISSQVTAADFSLAADPADVPHLDEQPALSGIVDARHVGLARPGSGRAGGGGRRPRGRPAPVSAGGDALEGV